MDKEDIDLLLASQKEIIGTSYALIKTQRKLIKAQDAQIENLLKIIEELKTIRRDQDAMILLLRSTVM